MKLVNPSARCADKKFNLSNNTLKIISRLFGFEVTLITLNQQSKRVNVAEELMNLLAFFIWHNHHDVIDETKSLSFI